MSMMNICRQIETLDLHSLLQPIMNKLKCCGMDYANVSTAGVWNLPLLRHPFANRLHLNSDYRYQDPYHSAVYFDALPPIVSLSDITAFANDGELWKSLLSPCIRGMPSCYGISLAYTSNSERHRFVFYYSDVKDAMNFYLNIINLPVLLQSLQACLKEKMLVHFNDFFIPQQRLRPLSINAQILNSSSESFPMTAHAFSQREAEYLSLLALGVKDKNKLAEKMDISARTIEDYLRSIKKKIGITGRDEIYEYAKQFYLSYSMGLDCA